MEPTIGATLVDTQSTYKSIHGGTICLKQQHIQQRGLVYLKKVKNTKSRVHQRVKPQPRQAQHLSKDRRAPFVLVHISDLHISTLAFRPWTLISKRFLGVSNWVFRRRRNFPRQRAQALVAHLCNNPWDHLLITGDLTQLGLAEEFALAQKILQPLLNFGPERVSILPGNHDRYTPEEPNNGAFEHYFGAFRGGSSLQGGILTRQLTPTWWLLGWDSAIPAPWFSASGLLPKAAMQNTQHFLKTLPTGAQVMAASHHPVVLPPQQVHQPKRDLLNFEQAQAWLLNQPIQIHLHGHLHRNWQITLNHHAQRPKHLGPLTLVNSASTTQTPHRDDPSAYHRIDLQGKHARVQPMVF